MKATVSLAIALGVIVYLVHLLDWDDRLYSLYHSMLHPQGPYSLSQYQFQEKIEIDGIRNLSGVIPGPGGKTLYMILNGPTMLIECDLRGNILRRVSLEGFDDTEGLCYDQNGNLVVIEERRQTILTLPPIDGVDVIRRSEALNIAEFSLYDDDNDGFEGLTYSAEHRTFFVAKEKAPATVFQFTNTAHSQSFKRLLNIKSNKLFIEDISELYMHPNGNLLILSDESAILLETDLSGEVQSYLQLDGGFNGNPERIPQAEGICIDADGSLYIVSEPNLLYIYRLPDAPRKSTEGVKGKI